MKFEVAQRCLVGSAGQDRIFARVFDDVAMLALADGAGGRAGGAEAAQIVVNEAAKVAQAVQNPRDANLWASWLSEVDERIENEPHAGETTAIIAAFGPDFVAGASVGDSSAWLISGDSWIDLTARQIAKPFLGQGATAVPFSARVNGQTLLLASDGLTKYADAETLISIARGENLERAANALIEAVRYASGALPDDVSCILCRAEEEKRSESMAPRLGYTPRFLRAFLSRNKK
ncbi:MAG TPA: protein phosphatase 2C domain-containing protein [Abditibacterium sp.]|jgi:serine/threonine protein phosphatase PrpC